jgi:hypothetical protein
MSKRILVEPGSYACHNMGDVAMMQVAVTRMSELWPQAEIGAVTSHPGKIQDAIREACEPTGQVRDALFSATARQIELSHAAYQIAHELCPIGT